MSSLPEAEQEYLVGEAAVSSPRAVVALVDRCVVLSTASGQERARSRER
jgi:hypothetical protein